jgi:hypothetical protein
LGGTNPFAITAAACVPSNIDTVVVVAKSDEDVVVVFDIDDLVLGVHHLSVFGGGRILEVNVKGGGGGLEILRVIGVNNAPDGRL